MVSSSSGQGPQPFKLKIAGSTPAETTMLLYSSGKEAFLSRRKPEFDSPQEHLTTQASARKVDFLEEARHSNEQPAAATETRKVKRATARVEQPQTL